MRLGSFVVAVVVAVVVVVVIVAVVRRSTSSDTGQVSVAVDGSLLSQGLATPPHSPTLFYK